MLPAVAVAVVLVAKVAVVIVVLGTRGFALTLRLQDRACRAFGVLRMGVLVSRVKRIWGLCAFTRGLTGSGFRRLDSCVLWRE